MKNMTFVMTFLLLVFGFLGCVPNKQNKQNDLESIRKSVIGKNSSWVKNYLGEPTAIGNTNYGAPRLGASPEEEKEFYQKTVAKIWIYDKFSVSFNVDDVAISVDPK